MEEKNAHFWVDAKYSIYVSRVMTIISTSFLHLCIAVWLYATKNPNWWNERFVCARAFFMFCFGFLAGENENAPRQKKNRLPFLVWTIWFDSMRTHNIIWLFDLRHREQRRRRRKRTPRMFEFQWKKREIITISPKGTRTLFCTFFTL